MPVYIDGGVGELSIVLKLFQVPLFVKLTMSGCGLENGCGEAKVMQEEPPPR